jgi:nucleotide-binding universal stress UspA family protein
VSSVTLASVAEQDSIEGARYDRILLASEGRAIPEEAIEFALELASESGASVRVLSIARVHGVAFGLQTPGLMPNKREWDEQREIVRRAVKRLKRRGVEADGHVIGTRKAAKSICQEAVVAGCEAIVMAADPDRNRLVGDFLWTQEPQRVRRRSTIPVFLVVEEG